ncbi:MAG: DUF3781 domain-containing protein [Paramuribaculum sp.]|nr:DUF3781 domain-containing protein [Paramuribaculum sp.]
MTLINIDKLHTTPLGEERISKNLQIDRIDIINYCRTMILNNSSVILRKGKNWYITNGNVTITVNAGSHTIITAHKISG